MGRTPARSEQETLHMTHEQAYWHQSNACRISPLFNVSLYVALALHQPNLDFSRRQSVSLESTSLLTPLSLRRVLLGALLPALPLEV